MTGSTISRNDSAIRRTNLGHGSSLSLLCSNMGRYSAP
jgi:hypothetical protein